MKKLVAGLLCWAALANPGQGEEAGSSVGRKIDNFELKDYRSKQHALANFADSKFVVIAFLGTECPLAKLYAPRLAKLAEEYQSRGVAFLGIDANCQDSITEIAAHARVHNIQFPILKDLGNKVADAIGARRTPEVFVLDPSRVVRYQGRIDDQYGVGYARNEPTRHDLQVALDELLVDKPVSEPFAETDGCHIGRIRDAKSDSSVTYSNQIARILQNRCVECHRAGDIAPFALEQYDEVAGWADTIAEVVHENRMPPWHANPEHGQFSNDRRLSDEEKEQISAWVAAGAPEGNPQDLPPPRTYIEGWQLPREPELIVAMRDQPYEVPAEGVVKYQYFAADPEFTEDKWIKMAEVLPGNRAVVHHVLLFVKHPGVHRDRPGADGLGYLVAYVPGLRARPFPEGMAKRIPAGAQLVFQVHYTPIGSVQHDLTKVGFVFASPEEVKYQIVTTEAVQSELKIPPHAENHRVEATAGSYGEEVLLLSMAPHMHLRGKSFFYEAIYPDGTRETLLDVPHYDFNWQTSYVLANHKKLPANTHIHCIAHFDNSEYNLANPDPSDTVRWGDQTWNEMMIGYFDVAAPVDAKQVTNDTSAEIRLGLRARAQQIIQRFDKNSDGKVTRDELSSRAAPFLDRVDTDGNGEITAEELLEAFQKRENDN